VWRFFFDLIVSAGFLVQAGTTLVVVPIERLSLLEWLFPFPPAIR
jgi:hypothetical protein